MMAFWELVFCSPSPAAVEQNNADYNNIYERFNEYRAERRQARDNRYALQDQLKRASEYLMRMQVHNSQSAAP
jgi:hypothetical protein